MPDKLVLAYVDSLRTDMLLRAVEEGRAPTFGRLLRRGVLVEDCVSSFPSVTPVASAEMVTGLGPDGHWINGMNWYHRLEKRYVEYGSSLEATRAFGIFRSLHDLIYNMNLAHLNPNIETLFEQLDGQEVRTASTPFLIYRVAIATTSPSRDSPAGRSSGGCSSSTTAPGAQRSSSTATSMPRWRSPAVRAQSRADGTSTRPAAPPS